jgi:hypothetical protein
MSGMSKAARGKAASRDHERQRRRNEIDRRRVEEAEARAESDSPLVRLANAPTPIARLHAIRRVRVWLDELEAGQVEELRAVGVSWARMGRELGVTGQAVSKRYRGLAGVVRDDG